MRLGTGVGCIILVFLSCASLNKPGDLITWEELPPAHLLSNAARSPILEQKIPWLRKDQRVLRPPQSHLAAKVLHSWMLPDARASAGQLEAGLHSSCPGASKSKCTVTIMTVKKGKLLS